MTDINDLLVKISEVNKRLGGPIIRPGSEYPTPVRISTGSLSLDKALGGGWPKGRIVMLWGNRSSGKSTLALKSIASAQRGGMRCLYIDAEKAFDPSWAATNGVDNDSLLVIRRNSLEEILDATHDLIVGELIDVVVLDSINTINSSRFFAEGNNSIGQNARAIGELLAKWNAWNVDSLIILISQARNKFSGVSVFTDHAGGLAAEHFPSVIVKLLAGRDKGSFIYDEVSNNDMIYTAKVGQIIRWEVTKSKVSTPYSSGIFPLYSDGRDDKTFEAINLGVSAGLIQKSGSWMRYKDKKFHGENGLRDALREDRALLEDLIREVMDLEFPQEG